jgi:hypothetical protein
MKTWLLHAVVLFYIFCTILACSKGSDEQHLAKKQVVSGVLGTTTILSTIDENSFDLSQREISDHGMGEKLVFSESGRGVAYRAKKGGLVNIVHNGKAGKFYKNTDFLVLSADGQRVAYGAEIDNDKWCMVVDGIEGMTFDSIGIPRFSRDGRHVLYDAKVGEQWHLVVDNKKSEGHLLYYDKSFSLDSTRVYSIENPPDEKSPRRMVVRDLSLNKLSETELFTKHTYYNKDMTRVAMVATENGMMRLVVFDYTNPKAIKFGPFFKDIGLEAFGPKGTTVAYVAEKNGHTYVVINDREERVPDSEIRQSPVIRPDEKEVGLILKNNGRAYFYQAFATARNNNKRYDEAANLLYSSDSIHYAYIAREGKRVFMVINGFETPSFDMIVTPKFSEDGKALVFRARKDGKRFVVVANNKGKLIQQYATYEMVFPPVFTADGKSVAYGVKDGNKLVWKVEKL